jgi:hypothetical protein
MDYDPMYGVNKFKALMQNPQQSSQNPMAVFSALMGLMAPPFAQKMDGALAQFGGQFPGIGALFGQQPTMPTTGAPMTGGPAPMPGSPNPSQPAPPMTGGLAPTPAPGGGYRPFGGYHTGSGYSNYPGSGYQRQSSYAPMFGGGEGAGNGASGFGAGLQSLQNGWSGRGWGGGGTGGEGAGGGNALGRLFNRGGY